MAIELTQEQTERFKAALASFTVHEVVERTGATRRTHEQNRVSCNAALENAIWFQPLGFKPSGLVVALDSLLNEHSITIAGVTLAGITDLRCIACQGIHGAPSQGFAPLANKTWAKTANVNTVGKARLFLVTYADGSKKIAYVSDTCFSEHFLSAASFKAFKVNQKAGKAIADLLTAKDAPKADAPKADAPKADAPKADAPKASKK